MSRHLGQFHTETEYYISETYNMLPDYTHHMFLMFMCYQAMPL